MNLKRFNVEEKKQNALPGTICIETENVETTSIKNIDKESGIWRLWDQPLAIPRASERLQKNVPKVKKELIPGQHLEMDVDESQFERTKEDDDEGQKVDRREEAKRIAQNYLFRDKRLKDKIDR